jgi:hypothetical protein
VLIPGSYLPLARPIGDAASATPRLLGWPCALGAARCKQRPLFKPRTFIVGSNYTFTKAQWLEWDNFDAEAKLTLRVEATGTIGQHRATVVFARPKRMCGVRTYTQWSTLKHADGARMVHSDSQCFFVIR